MEHDPVTYFRASTVDDLMHEVIKEIRSHGEHIDPTKGGATELTGVLLELTNPRARMSRTETRGKPYSCLGELCWYLAKTNDLGFISYYLPQYNQYADGDEIYGGYGPRLFNWQGLNQVRNVTELLQKKPSSRQAVLQLFDRHDIVEHHNDVPCTCTLQFLLRANRLHLVSNMRSNDVFWGMPHDIFCFTMIQEIVATHLGVDVGIYKHVVGSLHLYDKSIAAADRFLNEGWQSTKSLMPTMPSGDPWPAIASLLDAEDAIRTRGIYDKDLGKLDPYWCDLIRLLQVFRCKKEKDSQKIKELLVDMDSNIYSPFIENILRKLN